MGLFWAWLQIVFASPLFAPSAALLEALSPQHQVWTASLFVTLLTFGSLLVVRSRVPATWGMVPPLLGHGLMAAGTVFLAGASLAPSIPLLCIGVTGTGVGSGLAFLAWGDHLSRLEPRRALFDMAGYSFMTAVFFGVVMALPPLGTCVATAAMPIAAGVLLVLANRLTPQLVPAASDIPEKPLLSGGSLIGLAVLVGLVYGIMRGVSLSLVASSSHYVTAATVVGIAVAGVLLVATTVFFRKDSELYLVCQISFPLLAAGFLLLPQFLGDLPLPVIVFTIGHSYFYSLLWVFCVGRARVSRQKPWVIFAIGLLAFLGSSLVGSVVSDLMTLASEETSQMITIVSLVAVYSFIMAFAYLFGKNRKASLTDLAQLDEQRALTFQHCSDLIAAEGGLSPRESEIFYLLASGKDRADIRDACHISTDTVKSHTRRIYAKLNIHSKKEARTLVEERLEREQKGMGGR